MRKKLKFMQLATIIFMVALVVVHFTYLNKSVVSSLTDLQRSTNQLMVIKDKNTPIIKTKQKLKYPENEVGFQYQMKLYKSRLCTIELDGISVPVFITGFNSNTEVVLVRLANDDLNKKLGIDKYKMEHPNEVLADYILVQQRSLIEILLTTIVALLGLRLIVMGFKRSKEMVEV